MYIKPISKFSVGDIVKANTLRRLEIQRVIKDKSLIDDIFLRLKSALDQADNSEIENILSYELFFEIIHPECISSLSLGYSNLDAHKEKSYYIHILKSSYISKGSRGFLFSFMPIISKRLI